MDCSQVEESFIDIYLNQVTKRLQEDGSVHERSEEFRKLASDEARINIVLNLDTVHEVVIVPSKSILSMKSSDLALKYRNEGNKKFQIKDYKSALLLYNKSVAAAPCDITDTSQQNDLSLAYANRSAALFHINKHKHCLIDISRAFRNKYPKDLHYKLYDRQAKCLLALKQCTEAITAFENARNSLSSTTLTAKKKATWESDIIKSLQSCKEKQQFDEIITSPAELYDTTSRKLPEFSSGSNKTYTSLSSVCGVDYSENAGRYIIANENMVPGDVVLIEKPFASVLLPVQYETHCHHCFARYTTPIACKDCALAVFCSEDCRDKGISSYHRYECPILEAVHKSGVGKFGHLALRTMTIKGAEFYKQIQSRITDDAGKTKGSIDSGCNEAGIYNSEDYNTILNLVGHSEKRSPNDLFTRTVSAVYLLKCLMKTAFFPDNLRSDVKFVNFIGGLILAHLQSFPCNAHEISELVLDKSDVASSTCQEIGAGIYATLSLLNHSCDPTATRHFYGDVCVVRTIKPVKEKVEISDNYGAVYAVHTKMERQSKLRPQYYFECSCMACRNDWPLYDSIESVNPWWLCSKCKGVICQSSGSNAENGLVTKCNTCGCQSNLAEKSKAVDKATKSYQSGLASLLESNFDIARRSLVEALIVMHEHIQLPWRDVNNAEEALKQCFNTLGNCFVVSKS